MRLTDKHLEYYRLCVSKWVVALGLTGWRIHVEWCQPHEEKEDKGYVKYSVEDRIATIALNRDWDKREGIDKRHLNETAFHECCHLLLADLTEMVYANAPRNSSKVALAQEHNIIRCLENLVFRELCPKK